MWVGFDFSVWHFGVYAGIDSDERREIGMGLMIGPVYTGFRVG